MTKSPSRKTPKPAKSYHLQVQLSAEDRADWNLLQRKMEIYEHQRLLLRLIHNAFYEYEIRPDKPKE